MFSVINDVEEHRCAISAESANGETKSLGVLGLKPKPWSQ